MIANIGDLALHDSNDTYKAWVDRCDHDWRILALLAGSAQLICANCRWISESHIDLEVENLPKYVVPK